MSEAGTPPAGTPPAGTPPAGTPPAGTPPAPPAAFDWKSAGLDDVGMSLVNERQWKSPADLLTSYRNLEKLTGVPADKLIRLPGDDKPESWKPIWSKLGVPETVDGYKLPVPEGDAGEFAKTAAAWFHEANVPAPAAAKLAERWNEFVANQAKAAQEAFETAGAQGAEKLKTEWGAAHEQNMEIARQAARAFGFDEEAIDALQRAKGYDGVMKLMHALGSKIGEAEFHGTDGGRPPVGGKLTPEQAQAEINRLRNDRDFVARYEKGDGDARKRMQELSQMAAPGYTTF